MCVTTVQVSSIPSCSNHGTIQLTLSRVWCIGSVLSACGGQTLTFEGHRPLKGWEITSSDDQFKWRIVGDDFVGSRIPPRDPTSLSTGKLLFSFYSELQSKSSRFHMMHCMASSCSCTKKHKSRTKKTLQQSHEKIYLTVLTGEIL